MKNKDLSEDLLPLIYARVNAYFQAKGGHRKGNVLMFLKIVVYAAWIAGAYTGLLLLGGQSILTALGWYLLFGLGSAFFVVSVAHDASHQAISRYKLVNTVLSYSWNLVGMSKYLWEIKHHRSHHVYTNIPHHDVDIAENPLIRYSSSYKYKPYFRYQYIYALFLYGVFGIFAIYVRDFLLMHSVQYGGHRTKRHNARAWGFLIFTKLAYFGYSCIIPILILPFPWWITLLLYFVALAISGAAIVLMLVVPHINSDAAQTAMGAAELKGNDWVRHQVNSTVDYAVGSFWLNWFTGGLNTHVVHHLFPNICHVHYRKLTVIIRQTLEEQGLNYQHKSLTGSVRDHFRFLKQLGVKRDTLLPS